MEEARKKADENARKEASRTSSRRAATRTQKQMEIDFDVKNTGQKKAINGFDTHQVVMTITVREKGKTARRERRHGPHRRTCGWRRRLPAMKEVAEFDVRYAKALYGSMIAGVSAEQMAAALAMYPMMKDAHREDERRGREDRRHRHPDHDDH